MDHQLSRDREWTDIDLEQLRALDAEGASTARMARELGRDEAAVRDRLTIVRQRKGSPTS